MLLVVGLVLAGPGVTTGHAEETAPPAGQDQEGSVVSPVPTLGDIDEILEGEDEVLSGGGSTYDPGNRRDPFKSLIIVPDKVKVKGKRPEGIPGLLIDELQLSGIFKTRTGYVAQVQAADRERSYLIKVGDELFDGDVIAISAKEVVFKQNIQDPTALRPFREVVKSLNP
ncbi:MAG TPA: hypothetical protein PK413_08190 [Thermoanaerobaculia bacterium]|nr:hypothetical protein [Thermoanaerobaculia bacterium]